MTRDEALMELKRRGFVVRTVEMMMLNGEEDER